jgi:hypothetical protein
MCIVQRSTKGAFGEMLLDITILEYGIVLVLDDNVDSLMVATLDKVLL